MSAAMCILQFTYLCRVIVSAIDIPSVILRVHYAFQFLSRLAQL